MEKRSENLMVEAAMVGNPNLERSERMKKFTINRSIWRCGTLSDDLNKRHGEGETQLLNREGFMCCLGQVCEQAGVPKDRLKCIEYPRNLANNFKEEIEFLIEPSSMQIYSNGFSNSELAAAAVSINDNPKITLEKREKALVELFADAGYELEFIGDYIKNTEEPE